MTVSTRTWRAAALAVLTLLSLGDTPLRAARRAAAGDRSRAAQRLSLAQHRPRSRRPIDRGRRRQGTPARGVLRRRRRRPVEDHRRRQQLGAGHRRPDHQLLGRRGRRLGLESRRRLHRHGRVLHPRQHHAGRRRLQVDRRRQDVGERRLQERRRDLEDSHPPHQSRHRLRRGVRPLLRPERGTRRVQDHRRRQDLEAHAVQGQQDRRRRHRRSTPTIPTCSTPRCGRRIASSTRCRAAVPAAASTSPPTAARRGPRSRATPACRPAWSAASAWPTPRRIRIASTRSSKTKTAACSCRTMPARRGS